MILLHLIIIPIIFILIKLILFFIVKRYGKFSYKGFSAGGFAYNSEKDIFYSTRNAWQKNFGYTHIYDVVAPLFRMIIDTESIKFSYNNKNWLISFWKGQYRIVTGCEVGVYCTNKKKVNNRTIYFPVDRSEMLDMRISLYKNNNYISEVSANHWWLAIFKLGLFSKPDELTMNIQISFLNREMLNAFLDSFLRLGYNDNDFTIIDNTFCFRYIKPHTRKVFTRTFMTDYLSLFINHKKVNIYNEYLHDFIDYDSSLNVGNKKLIIINELLPDLLKNKINDKDEIYDVIERICSCEDNNIMLLDIDNKDNVL